jgi:hypothetical protein
VRARGGFCFLGLVVFFITRQLITAWSTKEIMEK